MNLPGIKEVSYFTRQACLQPRVFRLILPSCSPPIPSDLSGRSRIIGELCFCETVCTRMKTCIFACSYFLKPSDDPNEGHTQRRKVYLFNINCQKLDGIVKEAA